MFNATVLSAGSDGPQYIICTVPEVLPNTLLSSLAMDQRTVKVSVILLRNAYKHQQISVT